MSDTRTGLADHLPDIYSEAANRPETPLSALLFAAEAVFDQIDRSIDEQGRALDPGTAPANQGADFLSWLAAWVDLPLDQSWSDAKRRRLVSEAVQLYRSRGTPNGLVETIRRFFDGEVSIEEWQWPPGMEIGRRSTIGTDTKLIEEEDHGRCFQVRWEPDDVPPESRVRKIRALIDAERPAHTACYFVVDLGKPPAERVPALVLGQSSTIGECYIP